LRRGCDIQFDEHGRGLNGDALLDGTDLHVALTATLEFTRTTMPVSTKRLNPDTSATTSYSPIGMSGMMWLAPRECVRAGGVVGFFVRARWRH
jgi:hypothetical protein